MGPSSVVSDINADKLVFVIEEKCSGVKSSCCFQCHYVMFHLKQHQ